MERIAARRDLSGISQAERGSAQLSALCRAFGFAAKETEIVGLFQSMISPWGERPADAPPPWASDVCDDHSPYELSCVFGGNDPELRLLVEAHGDPPSLFTNWEAGRRLSKRLSQRFDVSLDRLNAIEDLFVPGSSSKLAIWHA